MTPIHIATLVAGGGWLLLACLLPWLRLHHRARAYWALVALGVPVLGLLTLHWGPMAGAASLTLGLAILFWPPRRHGGRSLPPVE